MKHDTKTQDRFLSANVAFKIDGYFLPSRNVDVNQAFDRAKKELIQHILKDVELIRTMTIEEFAKIKAKDFKA
jgi:hypothetical protein